jgi:uncharacterized membrane protein
VAGTLRPRANLQRASTMTTPTNNGAAGHKSLLPMILMGASYPLFAHFAVLSGRPALIAASIGLLAVIVLFPGLRSGRLLAWVLLLAAAFGLYEAAMAGQTLLLLFLPPILINGFMAWVFGNTLQEGRTPLIERAIILLHGPPENNSSDVIAYARTLTLIWAVLFASLASINLVLAALAKPGGLLLSAGLNPQVTVPLGAWSFFANVLNYVIVAAIFAVEYRVRVRRFPERSYGGFFSFMRRLASVSAMFRPANAGLASRPGAGPREG